MTKKTVKQTMDENVRKLRAAGWRVRDGGWPAQRAAEARWDFCRPGDNTLIAINPSGRQGRGRVMRGQADTRTCR